MLVRCKGEVSGIRYAHMQKTRGQRTNERDEEELGAKKKGEGEQKLVIFRSLKHQSILFQYRLSISIQFFLFSVYLSLPGGA